MTRHVTGHGSLHRGDATALPHVGYWIVEHRDGSMCAISGHVRGDVSVLDSLNRTGQPLLLRLDNGVRLPILLTEKRSDGAWEFTSTVESSLDLVSRLPRRD